MLAFCKERIHNLTDRQTDNCLNTIRLVAALQVMYVHITHHMSISMPEWFSYVINFFQGVPIFFILSGYLVWESVGRSNSYLTYLKKRFWRIYPELWCANLINGIILVVFHAVINSKDFILFLLAQSTILQFWTPESLRKYGCGVPNGSLWTICVLIQFYIVVWFIRKFLCNKSIIVWVLSFLGACCMGMIPNLMANRVPIIIIKLYEQTVLNYLYLFIAGAFVAQYKYLILEKLKRFWILFLFTAIIMYVFKIDIPFTSYRVVKSILMVYSLIGFAYTFPKFNIKTDISYGLYIYHMIIVNVFITVGFISKIYWMMLCYTLCIVISWISTKTIGRWSAKRKYS